MGAFDHLIPKANTSKKLSGSDPISSALNKKAGAFDHLIPANKEVVPNIPIGPEEQLLADINKLAAPSALTTTPGFSSDVENVNIREEELDQERRKLDPLQSFGAGALEALTTTLNRIGDLTGYEPTDDVREILESPEWMEGQKRQKELFKRAEEDSPISNVAGKIAEFAVVPGKALGTGFTALKQIPRVAKLIEKAPILMGAFTGGVQGAVDLAVFEGLTNEDADLMDVLSASKTGALFGTPFGALFGTVSKIIRAKDKATKIDLVNQYREQIATKTGVASESSTGAMVLDDLITKGETAAKLRNMPKEELVQYYLQKSLDAEKLGEQKLASLFRKEADKATKQAQTRLIETSAQKATLEAEREALLAESKFLEGFEKGQKVPRVQAFTSDLEGATRLEQIFEKGATKEGLTGPMIREGQFVHQSGFPERTSILRKQGISPTLPKSLRPDEILRRTDVAPTGREVSKALPIPPSSIVNEAGQTVVVTADRVAEVQGKLGSAKFKIPKTLEEMQSRRVQIVEKLSEIDTALSGRVEMTGEGVNALISKVTRDVDELKKLRQISNEQGAEIVASQKLATEIAPELTIGSRASLDRGVKIAKDQLIKRATNKHEFVTDMAQTGIGKIGKDPTAHRGLNEVWANTNSRPGYIDKEDQLAVYNAILKNQGKTKNVDSRFAFPENHALTIDGGVYGPSSAGWSFVSHAESAEGEFAGALTGLLSKTIKDRGFNIHSKKQGQQLYRILDVNGIPEDKLIRMSADQLQTIYPEFSKPLIELAKDIRPIMRAALDLMNRVRVARGQLPIKGLSNYISHMRKSSTWSILQSKYPQAMASQVEGEGSRLIAQDFAVPNPDKLTGILKKRYDKLLNKEDNAFKVLGIYSNNLAKEIYRQPAVGMVKSMILGYEKTGNMEAAKFWHRVLKENLLGISDSYLHSLGTPIQTGARAIRASRGRAALLFNIPFNLFTQTASTALTFGRATSSGVPGSGILNTFKGYKGFLFNETVPKVITDALGIKHGIKYRQIAANRSSSFRIKAGKGIQASVMSGNERLANGLYRTPLERVEDFGNMINSAVETRLQGGSVAAGYIAGHKMGYVGKELDLFANQVASRSQSAYSRIQRSSVLNSETFRTFVPFSTFSVELMNTIPEIVGKAGLSVPARVRMGQMMSTMVGFYFFNRMSEQTRGKGLTTPGSFMIGGRSLVDPVLAGLTNSIDDKMGWKVKEGEWLPSSLTSAVGLQNVSKFDILKGAGTEVSLVQDGQRLNRYLIKAIDTGEKKDLAQFVALYVASLGGVPGTVQFKRMSDTFMSMYEDEGRVVDGKGKLIINLEDPIDILSAFGVGARSAAKAKKARLEGSAQLKTIFD